jgi:hypothetical protein
MGGDRCAGDVRTGAASHRRAAREAAGADSHRTDSRQHSEGHTPEHAEELIGHIRQSLQIARRKFPNLRVAYLSSRIYAGYATTGLNPEP